MTVMRLPVNAMLLISLICLLFISGLPQASYGIDPFEIDRLQGSRAPDFLLRDLKGRDISLSRLRGRVVILSFFSTWCPPCKDELQSLNKLYGMYKAGEVVVIAIALDKTVSKVRDFLRKYPLDFPVAVDSGLKVSRQYKVYAIPTSFLINKEGIIIERFYGVDDWTSMEIREKIRWAD